MTLGFLVALFIYTRLIKKEVNQQMSMEVNKMVENYVSLTEQKPNSEQNTNTYNQVTVWITQKSLKDHIDVSNQTFIKTISIIPFVQYSILYFYLLKVQFTLKLAI